jgi:hypothetical protein
MMSKDLTVVQLERILERKRSRLDGLVKRRDRLQKQLASVEGRISAIGGVERDGTGPRKRRQRPKNDQPLIAVVLAVLSKHPKGLTLKEMAAKVLATGYKTNSDKFENTLYQCLYNNMSKLAHDADAHTYRLRAKPAKRAPRPKSEAKSEAKASTAEQPSG